MPEMAAGEGTRTIAPVVVLFVLLLNALLAPVWTALGQKGQAGIVCQGIIVGVKAPETERVLVAADDLTCTPLVGKAAGTPFRAAVLVDGTEVLECVVPAYTGCVRQDPITVQRGSEIRVRLSLE